MPSASARFSFGCDRALPFAAEIHDGGDADFLQLLNPCSLGCERGLEKVVDLAHVGNAVELDFFGKWRPGGMCGISGTSGTRASGNENEEKAELDVARAGFHKERAFNHLDENCKCKRREEKRRSFG